MTVPSDPGTVIFILKTLLYAALILVTLLVIIIAIILLIPFTALFQGSYERKNNELQGRFIITWLWGILRTAYSIDRTTLSVNLAGLNVVNRTLETKTSTAKHAKAKTEEKKEKPKKSLNIIGSIPEMLRLLGKFYRSLAPRMRLHCTIGFNDPYNTGSLAAAYYSIGGWRNLPVTLTPDFTGSALSVRGWFRTRIWLAHMLGIIITELLRPQGRQMIKNLRGR